MARTLAMRLRSPIVFFVLSTLACSRQFQGGPETAGTSGAAGNGGANADGAGGASGAGGSGADGGTSGGHGGAPGGAAGQGGTAGMGGAGGGGKAGGSATGGSGGSGATGGYVDSGGTAGGTAGADGGNLADATIDRAIDDCGCVADQITWGNNGGHVAAFETSSLSPCKTFSHQRDSVLTNPPTLKCTQELTACATSITATQIAAALAHPDVKAAIAAAPVLYGRDTRPVDGTVFRMEIGSAIVEIGLPCAGTAGCTPIPPGVDALATLLRDLTTQELGRPPCRETFRPG